MKMTWSELLLVLHGNIACYIRNLLFILMCALNSKPLKCAVGPMDSCQYVYKFYYDILDGYVIIYRTVS